MQLSYSVARKAVEALAPIEPEREQKSVIEFGHPFAREPGETFTHEISRDGYDLVCVCDAWLR